MTEPKARKLWDSPIRSSGTKAEQDTSLREPLSEFMLSLTSLTSLQARIGGMTPIQLVIVFAMAVVGIKFLLSFFDKDVPILNIATLGIMSVFIGFELFVLGRALLQKFG